VNTSGFPRVRLWRRRPRPDRDKSGSNRLRRRDVRILPRQNLNALNKFEEERHDQFGAIPNRVRAQPVRRLVRRAIIKNRAHFFASAERTQTRSVRHRQHRQTAVLTRRSKGRSSRPSPATCSSAARITRSNTDQALFFRNGQRAQEDVSRLRRHRAANHGFDFQKPAYSASSGSRGVASPRLLNERSDFSTRTRISGSSPAGAAVTTVGDIRRSVSNHRIQRALYLPSLGYGNGFDEIGPSSGSSSRTTVTFSREKPASSSASISATSHRRTTRSQLNGYYVVPDRPILDGSPQSIANLKNPSFFGGVGSGGQLQPPDAAPRLVHSGQRGDRRRP